MMKKLKNTILASAIILMTITGSASSMAQGKATLSIGDQAPALKYSKWIKGNPVDKFEGNKLYVIEFWATWCGPCKAAMPHLSSLAKKYDGKVTFVGMNIWEKTGDKPYESSLPAVTKYVNSVGDNMAYNVAADNNDKYMVNTWMLPAGQNGIPSTFLIKDNKVIWIGHPMNVDSIITESLAGRYDMAAFKKTFEGNQSRNEVMMAKFKALEPMQKAFDAKDFDKAMTLLNAADTSDAFVNLQLKTYRFYILLGQKKENEAIAFGKEWIVQNKNAAGQIAGGILATDGLSKESYRYAAQLGSGVLSEEGTVTPLVHHSMAIAYDKAGDLKEAIKEEEIAIKEAKDAVKNSKFIGSVTADTVSEYEKALADYKKKTQ